MKTFYRGFTIKTTEVKGEHGHYVMWSIYTRKGLVRDDNRPLLKARGETYKGEVREAQKHIDALLSGCRIKKFRRNGKYGGGRHDIIQLTEDQINLILTDAIFHEVCS